jgi:O-antigen/teichoic acid export membrane protein
MATTVGQQAARGAVYITAAHLSLMIASYLVAVVLARTLGPAAYGVFGLIYSFLLSIELIGRLGLPQALSRLLGGRGSHAPTLEATGFTLTTSVYVVIFAAFWALAPQLADLFHVDNGAELFRIASLDIPFYGMFFVLTHILNGRRDFVTESIAVMVYSAAKVVSLLVLLVVEPSIGLALILNVASSIVGVVHVALRTGGSVFKPTIADGRELLALAVPVAIGGFGLQLLLSVDLWMLNAIGTDVADTEKGFYVAALNVARMPQVIAFVLTAVLVPTVARAMADGDDDQIHGAVLGTTRFVALTLIPGVALIAVEARPLMALLFSEAYADSALYLQILIVAHGLLFTLFMTLNGVLIAVGQQRAGAIIGIAALAFALVANLVLIPPLGAEGAALAALAATCVAAIAAAIVLHRVVGRLFDVPTMVKSLAATLVVCVISWYLPFTGLAVLLEMCVMGLVFLGVMALSGALTRADIALFVPGKVAEASPPD